MKETDIRLRTLEKTDNGWYVSCEICTIDEYLRTAWNIYWAIDVFQEDGWVINDKEVICKVCKDVRDNQ